MPGVVKHKPECRHCGAILDHSLQRCSRCGKRSWLNLIFGGVGRRY
jgi:tRNA(Ile2) C34 agmatinyltransferase TiaS